MVDIDVQNSSLLRAGFARRAGALLIDMLLVALPFQVVGAILFSLTNGMLQLTAGLTFHVCNSVEVAQLPQIIEGLAPKPPQGSNFGVVCSLTFFGLPTARVLIVGREVTEKRGSAAAHKTLSRTYPVNTSFQASPAHNWNWFVQLIFAIYYFISLSRFGQSVGMQLLSTRLISLQPPDIPVGFWRVWLRLFVLGLISLPLTIFWVWQFVLSADGSWNDEVMFFGSAWEDWYLLAGMFGAFIAFYIFLPLFSRRDPVYDLAARTAVVMVNGPNPHA